MTAFASQGPRDLQANRLPTGLDNNPEPQERAALALQIDDARD
jgi:hypothetical protein